MYTIGLDVGTSSVKAALLSRDGAIRTCRTMYHDGEKTSPAAWVDAIADAVRNVIDDIDVSSVEGIGLTTQVGTYLLYNEGSDDIPVYGWAEGGAEKQLDELLSERSREFYIENIAMPHPKLISYPAPRIRWFKEQRPKEWNACEKLLAPKDYLYKVLTGIIYSDIYTWNGLVKLPEAVVTDETLELVGTSRDKLPEITDAFAAPGCLTAEAASKLGLKAGIPVYLGCNDSHASLAGMGVTKAGQSFDITGTSEHVGTITSDIVGDENTICIPFFNGHMTFGVNASAGPSIDWGFDMFGYNDSSMLALYDKTGKGESKPPIFLPYLCGERAPIWDSSAKGVFFGLSDSTTRDEMMYAILEGVVFSAYHMWSILPIDDNIEHRMRIGGGAAQNEFLNRMKSDIFGCTLERPCEKQSGALGAALIAAVGAKWYNDITEAADANVAIESYVEPHELSGNILRRFDIYRDMYPRLRSAYAIW